MECHKFFLSWLRIQVPLTFKIKTMNYQTTSVYPGLDTPPKINMEHGGLEDHFPFQMGDL